MQWQSKLFWSLQKLIILPYNFRGNTEENIKKNLKNNLLTIFTPTAHYKNKCILNLGNNEIIKNN